MEPELDPDKGGPGRFHAYMLSMWRRVHHTADVLFGEHSAEMIREDIISYHIISPSFLLSSLLFLVLSLPCIQLACKRSTCFSCVMVNCLFHPLQLISLYMRRHLLSSSTFSFLLSITITSLRLPALLFSSIPLSLSFTTALHFRSSTPQYSLPSLPLRRTIPSCP